MLKFLRQGIARSMTFIYLAMLIAFSAPLPAAEPSLRIVDSVIHRQRLLCLFDDGSIAAWALPTGEPDLEFAESLQRPKLEHLAGDSTTLWAIDNHEMLRWTEGASTWKPVTAIDNKKPERLVIVNKVPVLIYATVVRTPTLHQAYRVPNLGGQLRVGYLRVLTTHARSEMLWIGTGQGEWGGHLVGLNIRTGSWSKFHDPLHYVTGVTSSETGTLYASWSMSHFLANTLIRTHNSSANPSQSFPVLDDSYYQNIAYSEFDQKLYGIEQNNLVSIDEGKPTVLADLGKLPYDAEPRALGVAPAIDGLFAIAPKTIVVIHRSALPYIYANGELKQLQH